MFFKLLNNDIVIYWYTPKITYIDAVHNSVWQFETQGNSGLYIPVKDTLDRNMSMKINNIN